jgi:hypothetical protein
MLPTPLLIATALAVAPPPQASEAVTRDGARAEIANIVAAHGGLSALQRSRIVRQEGTVTSHMRGGQGRILRLFAHPGSLRVEIAYPEAPPEVRVVHGRYGDRDGREVTGSPAHAAMLLQAARLGLPLILHEHAGEVRDRGEIERGARRWRVLSLPLPNGLELQVEVDPATHRIARSVGSMPAPGGRIEFATEYSEFRYVEGALFAFHEENWARGYHTGTTALTRIDVLSEVPEGAFDERL